LGLKVYTGGTFDLFHSGHVAFLMRCAEIGFVTVSLNTDDFIATYKGNPPVMSYTEREAVLLACRYVNAVVPNVGGEDSKIAIQQVKPDLVIIGSDWARRDYYKQMQFDQDWLDKHKIGLCYIPYTDGISTTDLKKRITWRVK